MKTIRTILWMLRHPIYSWRGVCTAQYLMSKAYEDEVKRFCTELATFAASAGRELSEYADALDRQQDQTTRVRRDVN